MSAIPPVPPKSIPFAAARAYGVPTPSAPAFPGVGAGVGSTRTPAGPTPATSTPAPATPRAAPTGRPALPQPPSNAPHAPVPGRDRIEAPHAAPDGAARLDRLVAGRVRSDVNRGLDFDDDGTGRPRGAGGPILPLYTRSADRIEAATAIGVGRRIDVAG